MKHYFLLNENHLPVSTGPVEDCNEIEAIKQYLKLIGKEDYIVESANSGGKPLKYGMTFYVIDQESYSDENISNFMKKKLMERFYARPKTEVRRYAHRRK